jgi:chromosome partitioning protein
MTVAARSSAPTPARSSAPAPAPLPGADLDTVARDAAVLGRRIAGLRSALAAAGEGKRLRPFTQAEAARMLGLPEPELRRLVRLGEVAGPSPAPRPLWRLEEVHAARARLAAGGGPHAARVATGRPPGAPPQILAVTNFKGGSGKTTTAVHLAQHLAMRGYRVLAVDLDPQASLSTLFGVRPETDVGDGETLYGAIRYDAPRPLADVVRPTHFPGLDLVPGNLELQEFEHETPRALLERRAGPFWARLAAALDGTDHDVVVIDCPPQLGFLTLGALCAATGVLLTVHPQMLDVASMSQFLLMTADLMGVVRDAGAPVAFDFFRYVLTRTEPQDGPQAHVTEFLRALFGERVLASTMVKSTAIADAGLTKETLYEVGREAMTRSTYDRAIESLDAVNGEIEGLLRAVWAGAAVPA